MLEIIKIRAKELQGKYVGARGGQITGTHYALYEQGRGFCSLDGGKTVYMLKGRCGLQAMQSIIDAGGFVGKINYKQGI